MKLVSIITIHYLGYFLFSVIDARLSFPMVYKWSKRTKEGGIYFSLSAFNSSKQNLINIILKGDGCIDPTEPYQCPGTNICISLQFLCDGHPGDCPNNYDENQALCIAGIYFF